MSASGSSHGRNVLVEARAAVEQHERIAALRPTSTTFRTPPSSSSTSVASPSCQPFSFR